MTYLEVRSRYWYGLRMGEWHSTMIVGRIFVLPRLMAVRVGSRGDTFVFTRSPSWAWDRDKTPLSLALAWDGLEFL